MNLYIGKDKIQKRIKVISKQLSNIYKDKNPIFIGVLNGSFIFLSDLVRQCDFDCQIDFIQVKSYSGEKSSGKVDLIKDINLDLNGRSVILVEDIIDSGLSIKFLREHILSYNPKDFIIVSLLSKKMNYNLKFNIDIIGFEIDSKFIIGYGLDLDQRYRNLNELFIIE